MRLFGRSWVYGDERVDSMDMVIKGGEDVMTDHQFKALFSMVLDLLEKAKTIEDYEEVKDTVAKYAGDFAKRSTKPKEEN